MQEKYFKANATKNNWNTKKKYKDTSGLFHIGENGSFTIMSYDQINSSIFIQKYSLLIVEGSVITMSMLPKDYIN